MEISTHKWPESQIRSRRANGVTMLRIGPRRLPKTWPADVCCICAARKCRKRWARVPCHRPTGRTELASAHLDCYCELKMLIAQGRAYLCNNSTVLCCIQNRNVGNVYDDNACGFTKSKWAHFLGVARTYNHRLYI